MKFSFLCFALLIAYSAQANFTISENHNADCVVLQDSTATEPEQYALQELTNYLHQITGADFATGNSISNEKQSAIIVGPGALAQKYFPEIDLKTFRSEELIMRVKGKKLLLAGGQPRGTIYAVNRFLAEQCGVRWFAPWATNMPQNATLKVAKLDVREKPAFEYRGPYWYQFFDPAVRVHNCANNESTYITPKMGGCIKYKGFCHTFYPLVPPDKYFKDHPEWYSLIKGKRTHDNAQLCLTNPDLRDFMVKRVKEWLHESPDAEIISVTQNDCMGWCECEKCKAIDDAEGSHSGTMLSFVNYIAEKIEPEFPHVWVDTFAYQYTRKPPKTVKARHNVIVRLCSIECNFRQPLDHPSNAAFADDIKGWSSHCDHLYIWDYSTDFKNYVHPHPNWFILGDNARFFHRHGVKGLFSEGAYAGFGMEMGEMRGWVLSQVMWNPQQDDRKLIREFLDGYYGKAAARPIFEYLQLIHDSSKDFFLACYLRKEPPPYLNITNIIRAERLWQAAEKAAVTDPEKLLRVRQGHLAVRCAILKYWPEYRRAAWEQNLAWPVDESRKVVAEEFRVVAQGVPEKPWTHVNGMNEQGLTVETFLRDFAQDPPLEKVKKPAPVRLKNPPPPTDLQGIRGKKCFDLQDNVAWLYKPGHFAELLPDEQASDRRACWMPGTHAEWAFRISGDKIPKGHWKVYAVVRVNKGEVTKADAPAFTAGVYDNSKNEYPAHLSAKLNETTDQYHSYYVGTFDANAQRDIWVGPANNPEVKSLWVDRIYLVSAK